MKPLIKRATSYLGKVNIYATLTAPSVSRVTLACGSLAAMASLAAMTYT